MQADNYLITVAGRTILLNGGVELESLKYDALIIGSGGAGLRAAIAAKEKAPELKIALLTKGKMGKSGVTAKACSDRMAFHVTLPYTPPGGPHNWYYHAEDVYKIGGYASDGDLAVCLAKNSQSALNYLLELGVPFARTQTGHIHQFITDGSDYPRAAYTGPYTAVDIEKVLAKKVIEMDIEILEDYTVIKLITGCSERIAGVMALDKSEKLVLINSKTTIMATGGGGQLFAVNVFPPENTGTGYALAFEAGAELVNMEFIQIGLASLLTGLACSGSIPRSIPRLINDQEEEFLPGYMADFSTDEMYNILFAKGASWPVQSEHKSSRIDVAVYKENVAGRKVFLDFSCNPKGFNWDNISFHWQEIYQQEIKSDLGLEARRARPLNRLLEINPQSVQWFKERGIDLQKGDRIEIAPAIQHFQGGIKIRQHGETSLEGLFAAGECAGGQHGANRPGGHALLDGQVFGKIAGEAAVLAARELAVDTLDPHEINDIVERIERLKQTKLLPAGEVRACLQRILTRYAGVFRTARGLEQGLKNLAELKQKGISVCEKGISFALETETMFHLAEMIMTAARTREESRGPHLFFQEESDLVPLGRDQQKWQKYIVVKKDKTGKMKLERQQPVNLPRKEGFYGTT